MIKPLTSLRFIFALMVLLSHCISISSSFDRPIFQEGFVGVSFFFALSGFIISYRYKKAFAEQSMSKGKFWVGRIARIYPLHLVTLCIAVLLHLEIWQNITKEILHLLPNLFLVQSFIPEHSFYYSFNSPSWSLCCEFLFYALFPFLVQWLGSLRKLLLVLGIFVGIILIGMAYTPEDQTIVNTIWYVNPIFRLCDFLIGMLLFELYERYKDFSISYKKASLFEGIAIIIFLLFYLSANAFSIVYRASSYYWIPVSLIVFVFALQRGCISKLLRNRVLVYLGEISFGVYMFHFLVLDVFIRVVARMGLKLSASLSFAIVLLITLLVSSLSFHYFEKPANRWVKKKSYPKYSVTIKK